ncbi:MAG: large-conductance mechanosensitive channel [Thermonema sp.]|uniref:large-conductance mechanosensitive channel protein MscL n=1 Tax=Thermonema TaxID=28194 RepID=UPI000570EB07|nr:MULTISPECIES: large-conductance mechanosensitive channel protein MscL [Thermonema]GIV38305.1 MAG: large-conductance mechanosensitive channel [Thermonema sp.]
MLKEFKKFIMRGNVLDLAVAVIIGSAFNKIVSSLVNDLLMPPIGLLLGNTNFADLKWTLKEAAGEQAAVTLNYGAFIQTVVDFLIIGFSVFVIVKVYNRFQKKEEKAAPPPKPSEEVLLLREIRDALKNKA